METPLDQVLVPALERWRRGDGQGFAEVYRHTFSRVREVVRVRMGPRLRASAESGDVLQDVFLSLYASPPPHGVRSASELLQYLAAAATNRLRDLARHQGRAKRDVQRETSWEELAEGGGAPARYEPSPSEVSMGKEAYERYLSALGRLPEREREAILFARHLGFSSERCAQEAGMASAGGFRVLLSRALARVTLDMERERKRGEAGSG